MLIPGVCHDDVMLAGVTMRLFGEKIQDLPDVNARGLSGFK